MTTQTPVWFITAASSGFGREIALKAIKLGHKVIATARKTSSIQDLAEAGADTQAFDVTSSYSDIKAVADGIFSKYGRVDYLVNAAGFILDGAVEETSPEELQSSFNTNVFGTFNTIRAFLSGGMRAQPLGEGGRRGTVVTFGSIGSWSGGANYSVYAMTKACVSSLAESLREELAPFRIEATVVEPGYFRTSFLNPGVKVVTRERLPAYEDEATPSGQVRRILQDKDGQQMGDVVKGCEVVVDMLTHTGVGEGKELPVRIVLGSDCEGGIRAKCAGTIKILDEWHDVIGNTAHED